MIDATPQDRAPLPLAGVMVLDLSRILAGPSATQLLADYGADVIKVERPGAGDDTRHWGPPFASNGDSAYFQCANRGKRSITVDFTRPDGAAILRDLAAQAQVVVENFKTGTLAGYGLDLAAMRAADPRLVTCSITGFGQTGPFAARPGYDYLVQAMGGLMSITGAPDGAPGGEPMRSGVAIVDLFTGLHAATGILAALLRARATGQGAHLDIALHDTALAMLANQGANYLASGKAPGRIGNTHPNIVPYQLFATADAPVIVAVGNDQQYTAYCNAIGAPALAHDPRFLTNADRVRGRAVLVPLLSERMRTQPAAHWLATLEAAGVPCGEVRNIAGAVEGPEAQARGMVIDHGDGRRTIRAPAQFDKTFVPRPPPALGADTDQVLAERLGLGGAALARLRETGAI